MNVFLISTLSFPPQTYRHDCLALAHHPWAFPEVLPLIFLTLF